MPFTAYCGIILPQCHGVVYHIRKNILYPNGISHKFAESEFISLTKRPRTVHQKTPLQNLMVCKGVLPLFHFTSKDLFGSFLFRPVNGGLPLPTIAKTHFRQLSQGVDALSAYGAALCCCPFRLITLFSLGYSFFIIISNGDENCNRLIVCFYK